MGVDVSYGVEIAFSVKHLENASRGFGGMTSRISDLNKHLSGVGESFARSFGNAVDGVASTMLSTIGGAGLAAGGMLAVGLGKSLKEGLSFGEFVESSTNGLAATLSMLGDIPIDQGIKQASKSVENLRKQAAQLPGEFKDALGAFSSILPAGLNNGVSMARLEKLGAQSVAVAASLGIKQGVAGHELAAILEGRARSSMPLVSRLGIHATDWNRQSADKRFTTIEGMFGKMSPAMDLFGGSMAGLTSNARDQARNVAKTFAAPLYESIKLELGHGLAWFGANENAVQAWATTLGEGVNVAFHTGLEKIRLWTPAVLTFGRTLSTELMRGWHAVEPYLARFEKMALHFAKDPNAGHMLGSAAMALGGAKAASMGLDLGIDGLKTFGPMLSMAGFSAAELSAAALPAGIALAALSASAYGAFDILTDAGNSLHGFALYQVKETSAEFTHLMGATAELATTFRPIADLMGADLLLSINLTVGALDLVVGSMQTFYGGMKSLIELIPGVKTLNPTPTGGAGYPYSPTPWDQPLFFKSIENAGDEYGAKAPRIHNHNTTVNGGINIHVNAGSGDPNRIAKKVYAIQQEAARNPKSVTTQTSQYYRPGSID